MGLHLSSKYNFMRLQKWLDYEMPSSIANLGGWLYPLFFFLYSLATIVFIPVMIKILYQEKKFGWLVGFLVFIIIPAVLLYFIKLPFLGIIPLLFFLFYCILLKHAVREWLVEIRFEDIMMKQHNDMQLPDDPFDNYKFR